MPSLKKKGYFIIFWILSLTWNCIITYIGLITALILIIFKNKPFILEGYIFFEIGKDWGGLNLGPICIVSKNSSISTKTHEMGHGIQGIILGIFYPFVIAIPSMLRYHYYNFLYNHNKKRYFRLKGYNKIWFEKWSDTLGDKYFRIS